MDRNSKYIARLMFQNKVHACDGTAFETLFTQTMQACNANFEQVKPQGQYGDRKNDGFDSVAGTYYQVYAPENIQLKAKNTIDKLVVDFEGLYEHWHPIAPIKTFYYVVNDKYKGVYPSLHEEILTLRKRFPHVVIKLFLSKSLEDVFMELAEEKMTTIIGCIPESDWEVVELGVMRDVVSYLLHVKTNPLQEIIPITPDFLDKIAFNKLSDTVSTYLVSHRRNEYVIADFFEYNSDFTKNELRDIFNGLYVEAMNTVPDSDNKSDQVFLSIYEKAYPNHSVAIDAAIFTLMAYYFEYCDIFEAPV